MKGIVILLFVVCAAAVRAQGDECPEEEDGWVTDTLLRHEDCDKFYKCAFGKPVAMQCPSDLYFNLETWLCDWRDNVNCTDRNIPEDKPTTVATNTTATPEPTTTTESPEIEFQPNGCPVNPLIHWLVPHETDCNEFYYCVWGQLVLTECPSGLHFNRNIRVCDWPWDAGCPVTLNKHLDSRQFMK